MCFFLKICSKRERKPNRTSKNRSLIFVVCVHVWLKLAVVEGKQHARKGKKVFPL
jgi:hypothetical protein